MHVHTGLSRVWSLASSELPDDGRESVCDGQGYARLGMQRNSAATVHVLCFKIQRNTCWEPPKLKCEVHVRKRFDKRLSQCVD